MVLKAPVVLYVTESDLFSQKWNMGQNWAISKGFLILLKNIVLFFSEFGL